MFASVTVSDCSGCLHFTSGFRIAVGRCVSVCVSVAVGNSELGPT